MKSFLKSTTAVTMSAVLALPGSVFAQGELSQCRTDGKQREFPCTLGEAVVRDQAVLQLIAEGAASSVAQAREILEGAAAEAAAKAAAEAEAQAAAEAEAAAQAQAEAEAAAQAEAEAAAAAAAEEERLQREAEAAAQRQLKEQEKAERQAQKAAEKAARQAQREAERQAAEDAQRAREAEEQALERQLAREERRLQERAAQQAAAAAAAEASAAEAEVVTEEVTEEAVRSASEEFETAVTGTAAPQDDGGLSKFEKALLLGLGAAVVGTVLKNGDKVVSNSGDRVVVEDQDGGLRVLKDDDALIRRPGDEVRTETFSDGSSRTIVSKPDGTKVVTIRGRDGTVLRRVNVDARGREFVLFDDLQQEERVVVSELPRVNDQVALASQTDEDALRRALQAELDRQQGRSFSLRQVREISQVRALAPELELDAIRFATGSAAIRPEQARSLADIGTTLRRMIIEDPRTVILVEGHTDAVGSATYNLALSDRRAETVALALTEYFGVPSQNMVTQGYGESSLKVLTLEAEAANRRAVVRNITNLLR